MKISPLSLALGAIAAFVVGGVAANADTPRATTPPPMRVEPSPTPTATPTPTPEGPQTRKKDAAKPNVSH